MADQVIAALKKSTRGLLYPSETDAPFEPFVWGPGENSMASVRRLARLPASEKGRRVSLDRFFGDLLGVDEFRELHTTLTNTLEGIKVYRFGSVNPDYYLVGKDRTGRLAGLKTSAVET